MINISTSACMQQMCSTFATIHSRGTGTDLLCGQTLRALEERIYILWMHILHLWRSRTLVHASPRPAVSTHRTAERVVGRQSQRR